jgi:hypothetical protein
VGAFLQAIPAIIGGAGQVFAGLGSSKAAGAAANLEAGGYQDAYQKFLESMNAGNAYLQQGSQNAIDWAGKAADFAGGSAVDQAKSTAQDVSDRAAAAGQGVTAAAGSANALLDPYTQAGKTALGTIGDLANKQFTFNQDDPSYQWRLAQGQQALERSQAARGGSMGGAAAKALARYGQGAASTEYQAAFDRFQQQRAQQLSALGGLASLGYGAAGQSGQNLIGAGRYAGDVGLQAGEYGGNLLNQATQYQGNVGINAAQYAGNMGYGAARDLTQNTNLGYGNMANMILGRSGALAAGQLGQQQGKNQMWSGITQAGMGLGQGILGGNYFGGSTTPNTTLPQTNLMPGILAGQTYNPGAPPVVNPYGGGYGYGNAYYD